MNRCREFDCLVFETQHAYPHLNPLPERAGKVSDANRTSRLIARKQRGGYVARFPDAG